MTSPGPSERARQFHRDHPICDMLGLNLTHPRFLVDHVDLGQRDDSTCRGDFPKLQEWGLRVVMCKGGPAQYDDNFAALWLSQPERRPGRLNSEPLYLSSTTRNATQLVLAVLDRFLCDVEAHPDKVLLVRRANDLDDALTTDRLALLMGANRSDWFGDSLGVLRMAARLGLRMLTLSVSGRDLGYDGHNELRSGGRLTSLGVRVVQELNRQGILIDLAHTNEVCALDAIEVSDQPVVDSHSVPLALVDSTRSTSDRVMRALAAKGGLLGITTPISRPPGEVPFTHIQPHELERTLACIRYAVDAMGPTHVGLGTHFNSACLPWVTEGLLNAGFTDDQVADIMGGNYLRLLRQVLPE